MHIVQENPFQHRNRMTTVFAAIGFIAAGVLLCGHNAGWISDYWYYILFSWPMILVLIGFSSFFQWKIGQGIALWTVAAFFIYPRLLGENPIHYWESWPGEVQTYALPALFILGGVCLLIDLMFRSKQRQCRGYGSDGSMQEENGYVYGITSFHNLRHTVSAPVFKGARLNASFGSLALDLRQTQLDAFDTYIDLRSSFGGIELYVPSNWNVVTEAHSSFGGLNDKRFLGHDIDYSHKLIIRGSITFGGVEIKN